MNFTIPNVAADPVWPWSLPYWGPTLLLAVALLLTALTLWTYFGVPGTSARRIALLLALRLTTLLLVFLALLRPALAFRDDHSPPSVLVFALDASESMTIQDEVNNRSRWDELRRILASCEPILDRLRDEQNVTVALHRFGPDVGDFDPNGKADGKRSDYGRMLHDLHQRYAQERNLRGLLVFGDGADNGVRYSAIAEAAPWRALACPLHTFILGQQTTRPDQRDVAITALNVEPSIPIKVPFAIKPVFDASGFVGANVEPQLLFDDKEVPLYADPKCRERLTEIALPKATGNEGTYYAKAPDKAGEIKLTFKVKPLPGEVSRLNNEMSTYVTVTKEGLSVLLVDRLRLELKYVREALSKDRRIRVDEVILQTEQELPPGQADLFAFDKQAYDAIVIGDVSARVLSAGRPGVMRQIADLVQTKGVGLLMTGGADSFGGTPGLRDSGWAGTPIADLLPVELVPGQVEEALSMRPTPAGRSHYLTQLAGPGEKNDDVWKKLPKLTGHNRFGPRKPGGAILAAAGDAPTAAPLLVWQQKGSGRVLAFAADTTWNWRELGLPDKPEGVALHSRFWRQVVLWLAKQEEAEGNLAIELDARRLAAGARQGVLVRLKGKSGLEVPDARVEVKVIGPDGTEQVLSVAKEAGGQRGTFWKTDQAGEYRVVATGSGKDGDGSTAEGTASARFLVYQDDTEMLRQAAEPEFLTKLAAAGRGKDYRADELARFLQGLQANPSGLQRAKVQHWPDWRRTSGGPGGFLPLVLMAFVGLLGLEWGLRRSWGMV